MTPVSPEAMAPELGTELGSELLLLMRVMGQAKQRLRALGPPEASAYPVLGLLQDGPRRVSDLADLLHTDISTMSRRVSDLTGRDLVTKTRDGSDHRAHLLVLTGAGRDELARLTARYHAWLARVVRDWEPGEVRELSVLLQRFARDIERDTRAA